MKFISTGLMILFTLVALTNLWAEQTLNYTFIFCTKPLLMPLLAVWFTLETLRVTHTSFRKWVLTALLFATLGDVLLMLVEGSNMEFTLFLSGLSAFLVTQLCYNLGFVRFPNYSKGKLVKSPWLGVPFFALWLGMLIYLWPELDGLMRIAITLYSVIIITMAANAFNLLGRTDQKMALIIGVGALLFVLSDSLIAINKFKANVELPSPRLFIMSTYILGQFLIVWGSAKILKLSPGSVDARPTEAFEKEIPLH